MFKCFKCESLESEVTFLRGEVRRITDRLLAVSQPQAYQAVHFSPPNPEETYGSDQDEMVEYGMYGQKVLVTKKQLPS